ncbi:hypothetical protein [Streptomyces sp. NPDC047315]|uniref:hypothetical protein n=1 Tax=Streptomyces sp. NPDC047315 TaxID=3155142 RepID=UPI0033FE7854
MTASTEGADVIEPGEVRTRAEIRPVLGGNPQGGICPSGAHVSLYSDPDVGEQHGYYDGWLAEEDEQGPIFEYTGAGKSGDQTFDGQVGAGNRAVLHHMQQKRMLHLFTCVGKVPKSKTKLHRYLGAFVVDPVEPYVWRRGHGEDGRERNAIVFRLRPAEDHLAPAARDMIPPADETSAEFVPFVATGASFQADPATSGALPLPKQGSRKKRSASRAPAPNAETSGAFVDSETFRTTMSLRAATTATVAMRREAELTQSFKSLLDGAGHRTGAFQIKVKGLTSTLRTDLYDATTHVLYEAKGSSTREDIRMAIGQLLDYARYVTTPEHVGEPRCVILLTDAPPPDMYSLFDRHHIGVVYRSDDGRFVGDAIPGAGDEGLSSVPS